MDTLLMNDICDNDESAGLLMDDSNHEEEESLGISHQDSGLTNEHEFASHGELQDESLLSKEAYSERDVSNVLDEEQSLFSGAWNAAPSSPLMTSEQDESLDDDRGPLSPFSPLLRQQSNTRQQPQPSRISWQQANDTDLSLLPCRKVSVLVHVKLRTNDDQDDKTCLFPLLPNDGSPATNDDNLDSIANKETNDLVAVNPSAFGTYIPAQVTMETARLVANVANIESEDWARRYKFDQVLWGSATSDSIHPALNRLATSMGNDALLRGMGSVCIGVGGTTSNKTETMFGTSENVDFGLLGRIVGTVLSQLSEHAVCTLSVLEVVDEEQLRDLLVVDGTSKYLTIRHDKRGAVVHGLSDVPLDSMTGLGLLMKKAFGSRSSSNEEPRGHVVCSLKIWQNGVQLNLQNLAHCTTVTLADLASGEEGDGTNEARMASFRKSVSGLRGVLRSLLQQEQDGRESTNAASFRECTLTQVLQRPLSEGRSVVLGNVSAGADSYERTLHTLNYMNRLLIRPGKTARSPFTQQQQQDSNVPESPALFDRYVENEALLESVVSDPRQRLAKVLPPRAFSSPTKLRINEEENDSDEYEPIDYMQIDPGEDVNGSRVPLSPMREEHDSVRRHGLLGDDESIDKQGDEMVRVDGTPLTASRPNNASARDTKEDGALDATYVSSPTRWKDKNPFKSIVSLSEESSTQPVDSMSSSARTGLRLAGTSSPDDVDGWIASFEENEEDAPDSPLASTPESVERVQQTPPNSDGLARETKATDANERPPPDHFLPNTSLNDPEVDDEMSGGASGDCRSSDLRQKKSHNEATLFAERKTAFSTPKAVWPELEVDDASALSLSSLQNDVHADIRGSHERRPIVSSIDRSGTLPHSSRATSSQKQAVSEEPAIPSNIETTSRLLVESKRQTDLLSPSDQCIGEIHALEDAVDESKRLHNGLWETSALSLDRLRHSQELQKRAIEDAVSAQNDAEAKSQRLEVALAHESEAREQDVRDYKERLAVMESRIEKALVDRSDMETIAEEAIAAQDRLEQSLSMMQKELDRQHAAAERMASEHERERESSEGIARKLDLAMKSLHEMRSAHSDCKDVIEGLGETIDDLRNENEKLKEERDASQALSSDQSRILAEQERLKQQFDRCQEEISSLQEENTSLSSNLRNYQDLFEKAGQQQKTLRIQFESENLALQNDVDEWQRRYLEAEDDMKRAAQEIEEERIVLLNELSDLKKQLEEVQARTVEKAERERDERVEVLVSELQELQLEREHEQMRVVETEQKYEKLRNDAKEKLKLLVKEKKATTLALEKMQDENAAHCESNQHLLAKMDHLELEREDLQHQMNGLLERLAVEEVARQEAEERIQELESKRSPAAIHVDSDETSNRSSLHLDDYSEAELALLKQLEAEKSDRAHDRRIGNERETSRTKRMSFGRSSDVDSFRDNRVAFAQSQRNLDSRYTYGNDSLERDSVNFETYRAEQNRRLQAEDLAAAMAVRAKDGIEKRNREIMTLKMEMTSLADEKETEILRLRQQLHLLKRESLS